MGHVTHHTIVVTGFRDEDTDAARTAALGFDLHASEIVHSHINGYTSFFVAPDGSKSEWEESDEGDDRRRHFIAWMVEASARGVYLEWVEVSYGRDDRKARVVSSCADYEEGPGGALRLKEEAL